MRTESLPNRNRIYIPTKMLATLKTTAIYRSIVADGATIYSGIGIWRDEEEAVSIVEVFGDSKVKLALEMLAEVMLGLGEEAVLIDSDNSPMLYFANERTQLVP